MKVRHRIRLLLSSRTNPGRSAFLLGLHHGQALFVHLDSTPTIWLQLRIAPASSYPVKSRRRPAKKSPSSSCAWSSQTSKRPFLQVCAEIDLRMYLQTTIFPVLHNDSHMFCTGGGFLALSSSPHRAGSLLHNGIAARQELLATEVERKSTSERKDR